VVNISPTTNLLVIQGADDPRVVTNESNQIVERLRSKSIDVEYMVLKMKDTVLPSIATL
jgi:dipeptidyl aminopeptidase/acylaminoacyl peptidase